ncbi:MAG: hypothetical protein ABI579_04895 [Candidatus Sumerlaeota bacterium]
MAGIGNDGSKFRTRRIDEVGLSGKRARRPLDGFGKHAKLFISGGAHVAIAIDHSD